MDKLGLGHLDWADSYAKACELRRVYADEVVRLGMARHRGVYIKRVWLNPHKPTYEICVGKHEE